MHLAQRKPAAACDLVGAEAKRGTSGPGGNTVDDAFWSLTLLGDACRGATRKLLSDPEE